jgi:hypothetical protein
MVGQLLDDGPVTGDDDPHHLQAGVLSLSRIRLVSPGERSSGVRHKLDRTCLEALGVLR